ncbi:hypothetical protein [Austwickia sp. TVS 96-490-7B]|uniref:hypothetical protein n=1 Tax=Austwickia sp. TVS 96-490-7B TaxID=2830843 RepID=UPI001C58A33F|nr:hypothetical protein [Austwickia sp. TVS 96-490-7B]
MSKHLLSSAVVASLLAGAGLAAVAAPANALVPTKGPRPVFAIAHRVTSVEAVDEALNQGANAIHIDAKGISGGMTAVEGNDVRTGGRFVEIILKKIANARKQGKTINFVWLEFHEPHRCTKTPETCSGKTLRELARNTVEKENIRVVFGFGKGVGGADWKQITEGLNDKEAVSIYGPTDQVIDNFEKHGKHIKPGQRILNFGHSSMKDRAGDCTTPNQQSCYQLKQAAAKRNENKIGNVFGWTTPINHEKKLNDLFTKADVDGVLAVMPSARRTEVPVNKPALSEINKWVKAHPQTHRMAGQEDRPW